MGRDSNFIIILKFSTSDFLMIFQVRQDMVEAAKGGMLDEQASQKITHLLMTLADYKGVLVKLADRVVDLQRAVKTNAEHTYRSATEALELFAPMANRLGVWSLKAKLEDLAFQVRKRHCVLFCCNYNTFILDFKICMPTYQSATTLEQIISGFCEQRFLLVAFVDTSTDQR